MWLLGMECTGVVVGRILVVLTLPAGFSGICFHILGCVAPKFVCLDVWPRTLLGRVQVTPLRNVLSSGCVLRRIEILVIVWWLCWRCCLERIRFPGRGQRRRCVVCFLRVTVRSVHLAIVVGWPRRIRVVSRPGGREGAGRRIQGIRDDQR